MEDIPPGWAQKAREFVRMLPRAPRPVRGAARPQRDLAPADEERGRRGPGDAARAGRDRPAAARDRRPLGPAQGDALQLLRALRLQDPGGHRRRQLRPLPRAHGRDARVVQDRRAGARRPARGPVHHRQPQGGAAAAARAGHLDGGADPPLQARDRGLPRAAGRGLRADRVAARRAGLLRRGRRLGQARARAHARPVVREPPGAEADGRGRAARRPDRLASRCSTRFSGGSTGESQPSGPGRSAAAASARLGRAGRSGGCPGRRARSRRGRGARGAAARDRGHSSRATPSGIRPRCRRSAPRSACTAGARRRR